MDALKKVTKKEWILFTVSLVTAFALTVYFYNP